MSKIVPYLTITEALGILTVMKQKEESGSVPFVIQSTKNGYFCHCKLVLEKASANSVYKGVSRGGQPVVVAIRTAKPDPLLTIDEVRAQLQCFIDQFGGDIPFLAKYGDFGEFQLCDIWPNIAGASNVLKSASRGGQRVANVVFYTPDK
jgi:hypothetical protein